MYQSKRKKIVSKIVTLGMVVMLFASIGMMGASAALTDDFSFSFNGGGLRYTDVLYKNSSSSMYMYCADQSQNYTYRAWAQGGPSTSNMVNCDGGVWQYTFSKGTSYNIKNLVRENGYRYARIAAQPANSSAYYANGNWKPDI